MGWIGSLTLIANQIYLILLAKFWENGLKVTLTKDMAHVKKKTSNSIGGGVDKLGQILNWNSQFQFGPEEN